MFDWFKWGLRIAGALAILAVSISVINLLIQLPVSSLSFIGDGLSLVFTIGNHYTNGAFSLLWASSFIVIGIRMTLLTTKFIYYAHKKVMSIWI